MKKISQLTLKQIQDEMEKLRLKSEREFTWLHNNRRYKALSNERVKRSGLNIR